MKKLIITATPNKESFTSAIANKLLKKYKNSEIIDLYDQKYKLDFLIFEDKRNMPKNDKIELIQQKIKESEEIIFVFPVWWGSLPAIMKNMFDSVFISDFAFYYDESWKHELLNDKFWSIIATCDAPANIYLENSDWTWVNLKTYFEKALFWFCGVKMKDFKLIWSLREKTLEERKEILESI